MTSLVAVCKVVDFKAVASRLADLNGVVVDVVVVDLVILAFLVLVFVAWLEGVDSNCCISCCLSLCRKLFLPLLLPFFL